MVRKTIARLMSSQIILFFYSPKIGPYSENNILTPESNVSFNESLKSRNPLWGIKDICDLKKLAEQNSMTLFEIHSLPSNNKLLVWKKN